MSNLSGSIEVFADPASLARGVAEWMTTAALAADGPFRVSLSGGGTPKTLYTLLASDEFRGRFPWARVHWYWGDERFVPHDDPDSNFDMVRQAMLARAPVPPDNIHPVPTDGDPDIAALRYERVLRAAYGAATLDPARPLFDITLLGLGSDGHTASLLPGDAALEEQERWVVAVRHGRPETRITLTFPVIDSSRRVAFLVSGKDKAAIFSAIQSGDERPPSARVRPIGDLLWFVDQAVVGADSSQRAHADQARASRRGEDSTGGDPAA